MPNQYPPSEVEKARRRCRELVALALAAARAGDWKTNHRLCREHDDIAITLPIIVPEQKHLNWHNLSARRK